MDHRTTRTDYWNIEMNYNLEYACKFEVLMTTVHMRAQRKLRAAYAEAG